tara:strand:- start:6 stop:296 length:291 start_codon:yes stop_codon:yes gene_type:complete
MTKLNSNLLYKVFLLGVILVLAFPINGEAQSRKRLRELEKMEDTHEEDEDQMNEEGKKQHMSIQSKSTRKQMKRYQRMNKRHNKNRKPLFRKRSRH